MSTTVSQHMTINVPIKFAMESFLSIESWSSWGGLCTNAKFLSESNWAANSRFSMSISLHPLPITLTNIFTLTDPLVLPENCIEWNANKFGLQSRHRWVFKEIERDVTRLESVEHITGVTLFLFRPVGISLVIKYLNYKWMHDLKVSAETKYMQTQ